MLPSLSAGVAALRRRCLFQGWLELAGVHAQVMLFAVGAAALLGRAFLGWGARETAAVLALAALSGLTALVRARATLPAAARAAAWLDVGGGGRGLVVTESELGASAWSHEARAQLEAALRALPRPRWGRPLRAVLPAAAFAALAAWVPIPREEVGPPPALTESALEELEAKLATLEETLDLPPATAEELETRLERIEAEAETGPPASTFEAIDRLGERLDAEGARALDAAQRALGDLASAAGDPHLADAQGALGSALEGMKTAGFAKDLPEAIRDALQPGTLSLPAGVQLSSAELAALSQGLKGVLDERLAKLAAGGLVDARALRELRLAPGELGELGDLSDLEYDPDHVCDEDCKKPGGT